MKPETSYEMYHEIVFWWRRHKNSPTQHFTTGPIERPPIPANVFEVSHGPETSTSLSDGVILHALLFGATQQQLWINAPVATDLEGNLIWYYKEPALLPNAGSFMMSFPPSVSGTFLIPMARPPIPDVIPGPVRGQLLREIDLAGNTIRETNVERINEQLLAMGYDPIYYFHHDIRRLPNGHTLAMAGVERIEYFETQQGIYEYVDMVGDMIIDLDENFQMVWAWSTFDHEKLPLTRRALRDEECTTAATGMNVCCPLRLLGQVVNGQPIEKAFDWTHGNTVTYTPADGNLIISFRHQDWVIKVDYRNGKGSGEILWRLGNEGDFQLEPDDPDLWFSGQHQPMIYAQDELVVYDNGNALNENGDGPAYSRGKVYLLDEDNMVATQVVNADPGVYASFLGSAQKFANGNYHFLSGGIAGAAPPPVPGFPSGYSESTETDAEGNIVYTLQTLYDTTYRSFRMKDMYRPAGIPGDVDGDSDVDRIDLAKIVSKLLRSATDEHDPCDLDKDGWIGFNDLSQARSQCTRPNCEILFWLSPVIGY